MSVAEMPRPTVSEAAFIRQAKQICNDLMTHSPVIYWVDFLASATISWTALLIYLNAEMFSAIQIVAFVIAGLMLYRTTVFTHELAHMAPSRFRLFRVVWNLLFGVPFLMPTFLYTDHRVHHTNQTYGTAGDGEYYPFASRGLLMFIGSLFVLAILPALPLIRFGILGPASWFNPKARKWVWAKASSLGTASPKYRREDADADERRAALWQEPLCTAVVWTLFALLFTGVLSWTTFWLLGAVYIFAMMVNNFRVWAAHRYVGTGEPMTFLDQMLDSTTISTPLGVLWAPLGMRFHALHHLFPAMPYHAMGKAHRRLMAQLPPDSPYHQTVVRSMPAAIMNLVRAMREHRRRELIPAGK
jgi:fatty acid desaturase